MYLHKLHYLKEPAANSEEAEDLKTILNSLDTGTLLIHKASQGSSGGSNSGDVDPLPPKLKFPNIALLRILQEGEAESAAEDADLLARAVNAPLFSTEVQKFLTNYVSQSKLEAAESGGTRGSSLLEIVDMIEE